MLHKVAAPGSLPEVHALLAADSSARILAGGTALMPLANAGSDDITTLVSLRRAGLSGISVEGGRAVIGAAATLTDLAGTPALAFLLPALDAIASPTIRNMATVGGNLFVSQPYGDLAACLLALDATVRIDGAAGLREVPVAEVTARSLAPGDIVTSVAFELPAQGSFCFAKAGRKALNAAAIVTVAAIVDIAGGIVSSSRIALGGVAQRPVRAVSVERALAGKPFDADHVMAAAREAAHDIDPFDDAYASAWYRARVTPVHIRRALLG